MTTLDITDLSDEKVAYISPQVSTESWFAITGPNRL